MYWIASLTRTNTLSLVLVSISAFSCSTCRLIRPATRSTNGVLVCSPGPATRTNFPKRSTIARSCCSTVKKNNGISAPFPRAGTQALADPDRRMFGAYKLSTSPALDRGVTSPHMDQASNPAEFVGYQPDERLLGEDLDKLPTAVGRPEVVPRGRARGRIVGTGATLTAASLVIGV